MSYVFRFDGPSHLRRHLYHPSFRCTWTRQFTFKNVTLLLTAVQFFRSFFSPIPSIFNPLLLLFFSLLSILLLSQCYWQWNGLNMPAEFCLPLIFRVHTHIIYLRYPCMAVCVYVLFGTLFGCWAIFGVAQKRIAWHLIKVNGNFWTAI